MISVTNIDKSYNLGNTKIQALRTVSLTIKEGELVCIMGPSGSGKTTLLNILGCLDKPDNGEVLIGSEDVVRLDRNRLAEIRSAKIGFIFQSFNLIPVLNVYENIEFPMFIKKEKISENEKKKRVVKLIEAVGLKKQIKHKPEELSGGQRQRVAIARALVNKPSLVLADEPTANLDSVTAQQIIELMMKINKEENVTFIFATHDPSITNYASKVYHLKDGMLNS